jgi:putative transposase
MSARFLALGSLLESDTAEGGVAVYRLLHIDPETREAALIDVEDPRAYPIWRSLSDLEDGLSLGHVRRRDKDPYSADTRPDSMLSESARRVRDRRWEIIAPLVEPEGGDPCEILRAETRGPLVAAAHRATGCAWDKLYDWLRAYWRGGQVPNALLPGFDRCGAPGRDKPVGEVKRGRPRKVLTPGGEHAGLNVNAAVLDAILKGARRYVYRKWKGRRLEMPEAYQLTKEDFFRQGVIYRNGTLVPLLRPPDQIATLGQFAYWAEKYRNREESQIARYGERRYRLKHRPVLGSSEHLSRGPGDVYLVDATVGDIYLVSEIDRRRVIGRPVIYLVIDHFTRMIVGIYVALEGPSYLGAMMALENAFTDKVAYCRRFGREIQPEDWPCFHVPRVATADRAELLSENSDELVPGFRFRMTNTPGYRADFKAYVEAQFQITNETGIRREPGWVDKARDRGDPDYRLDAVLTLYEFTQLMIDLVLYNNRTRSLLDQVPPDFPLSQDAAPVPLDLWEWGTATGRNLGRVMDPDRVRVTLLPTFDARATRSGLEVLGGALCYESATGHKEGWFLGGTGRASHKARLKIDPRDVSLAHLWLEDGRVLETCELTPKSKLRFQGRMLEEVQDDVDRRRILHRAGEPKRAQALAEFHAVSEARDRAAEEARQAQAGGAKVIPILQGQREARRAERDRQRRDEAFVPRPDAPAPQPDADPDDYIPFPS